MVIAITRFEGLCGFRPLREICHFLKTVPSLRKLVGGEQAAAFEAITNGQESQNGSEQDARNREALKQTFSSLVSNAGSEVVGDTAKELLEEARTKGSDFAGGGASAEEDGQELADLLIRLNGQFPDDIGLFVLFFLNYVKLQPGEAMFLRADDIHAYLAGGMHQPYLLPDFTTLSSNPIFLHIILIHHSTRRNRMHGRVRQRRPRRLHPEIQRHSHPHRHAHLLLRPNLRTENVPAALSARQVQRQSLHRRRPLPIPALRTTAQH